MNMVRLGHGLARAALAAAALVAATIVPAAAQSDGPGFNLGNPVCSLVNFAFCPQPAPPPPPYVPAPDMRPTPTRMPGAMPHKHYRKHVVHPKA